MICTDGSHLCVAWDGSDSVSRHELGNKGITRWTGATGAFCIISEGAHAYITGFTNSGRLYETATSDTTVNILISDLPLAVADGRGTMRGYYVKKGR